MKDPRNIYQQNSVNAEHGLIFVEWDISTMKKNILGKVDDVNLCMMEIWTTL
jgi:hypothetical protein